MGDKMNEYEIMNSMKGVQYGWLDKFNHKNHIVNELFADNYILQSPKEIIKNKIGVCWDQVELERYYFNQTNLKIKTYFICHYNNDRCLTHTFLIYEKGGSYYWFEHSWEKYRGIYKHQTIKELLCDVRDKFIETELNNCYQKEQLMLYEYTKPKYGISVIDFFKHCEKGEKIDINNVDVNL